MSPARDPYRAVKRHLRQEVGFCCPVEGCGNPYLTWHHFDPPWRVEQHHRPEGMIALCAEHASKADHGSFTDEQLRELKRIGRSRATCARARFDWMRQKILAIVGGNFYYESPIILAIGSERCVWWNRDEQGNLLLNVQMPGAARIRRPRIEDNWWSVAPEDVAELEAPPNGRKIRISYPNGGDYFSVEFSSVASIDEFLAAQPEFDAEWVDELEFPLTIMQLSERITDAGIELNASGLKVGGEVQWVAEGNMYRNLSVPAIGINNEDAVVGVFVRPATLERLLEALSVTDP